MLLQEVIRTLEANVGRRVKVWIRDLEPEIVLVLWVGSEDQEVFTCRILTDPDLYDPTITHDCQFFDVTAIEPLEDS